MRYYAIADLHGRFDLLEKAMMKITEHALKNPVSYGSKIIMLGDYIDRGPDSRKVIELLMDRQSEDFICLQGNHESMMVECMTHNLHPDWWIGNGGKATMASYGWIVEDNPYTQQMYNSIPKEHFDWVKSLPLYYETKKQVFVHAGIPQWGMNLPPSDTPKGDRMKQQMQWMIYSRNDSGGWKGKHVVHGHHQFADGPHQWLSEKTGGRTDLDCWAYHTGRLVIGVFDDTQNRALEFLEVTDGS